MKRQHFYSYATLVVLLLLTGCGTTKRSSQGSIGKQYNSYAVAFYNVENLFDCEDDPANRGDDEFLPSGPYNWTQPKYERKLDNVALVLSKLGREHTPMGPAIIGVAEVENRRVLEDLVSRPTVADMGLQVVHEDSPDRRGIDVGLLYNPKLFTVTNHRCHRYPTLEDNPTFRTRDQLLVSGKMAGEEVHVIVCHWPSRYGGAKSSYLRETAAGLTRHIADSLYNLNPRAKIIVMGDMNDDPNDASMAKVLDAKQFKHEVPTQGFYNTTWAPFAQGIGTLVYQDKWNLFDQIAVSEPLISDEKKSLTFWKVDIFNRPFLHTKEGKRKGYPHRTFDGNTFIDGYSDHFPVVIYLLKER